MLKIIGSLLVVGSMSWLGVYKAKEVKKSYEALLEIRNLIGNMQSELRYARTDFGEMFERLSRHTEASYRNWLLGMKIQMERKNGGTFSEIWCNNADGFLKESGLDGESVERLKMLGKNLGGMDVQMQIRSMERYLDQVSFEIQEMRSGIRMRMRVRVCLGISFGILIMLILI